MHHRFGSRALQCCCQSAVQCEEGRCGGNLRETKATSEWDDGQEGDDEDGSSVLATEVKSPGNGTEDRHSNQDGYRADHVLNCQRVSHEEAR